jgi:iron complex outermembrane receptor protein
MGNHRKLQFAIRAAIAAAAASSVAPVAISQTTASTTTTAAPDSTLTEVIVTGSRINSPNLDAVSPVTSVSAVDIERTGLTRVEDFLNQLPQVFAGQNNAVANGSDGTATVDLRNLGAERTLVLIDGKRLGPGQGDGRNYSDINQIPAALIERVDILTGGASATYGADAVAGVVNFIMNTHYDGIKIDAGYDFYNHHNDNSIAGTVAAAGDALPPSTVDTGFGKNVSVVMGSGFADDRGHATAYLTYDVAAPVLQSKYDYSACSLGGKAGGGFACGGSETSAKNGAGGYFQAYGSNGKPVFTNTVDGKTGAFRPYNAATDLYNYGPLNFYQNPNTRWTAGSFLDYEINDHATVYSTTMYTNNRSSAQIAASGDFFTPTFIPCADPLLTAQEKTAICAAGVAQGTPSGANLYIGRRNVEGGGRVATFASNAFREVVGVKGDIDSAWSYDVYAQRGTVDTELGQDNYFSASNVANALNVVTSPTTGQPVCQSVISGTDTRCVPWNIWVPNGVTSAATNYLSIPLLVEATTTEYVVDGTVQGDLGKYNIKLPMANEGVKVSVGAEWRSESSAFSPDYQSELGNAEGSGGPTVPVSGGFTVKEIFTEFTAPLVDDAPFAKSLALLGGYRYSDYSEGFKTNTYKIGLEWAPVSDVKLRGSFQRAVRAPNVSELYTPASVQLDGSTDPCSGAIGANGLVPSGATRTQCAAAGVTAAQYGNIAPNPAGQYNGFLGGNPSLKPETALSYSVGFILQPHWVQNLSFTVDYFDIKVENTIGSIGADTILQNCIATERPTYCDLIHRDANGSLWKTNNGYVDDVDVNFGSLVTKGADVTANYSVSLNDFGKVLLSLQGTKLIALDVEPLTGGPAYNCAGYFGATCGNPSPQWRSVFNTTWVTPWNGAELTARWRYYGSVSSELSSADPQLTGTANPASQHINAYSYFDLSGSVSLYKTLRLSLGVNNLLDKDPPIVAVGGGGYGSDCVAGAGNGAGTGGGCNGNTFPGTYDSLGRYLYARVTAKF